MMTAEQFHEQWDVSQINSPGKYYWYNMAEAYAAAQLRRYADHDPSCPEFKQKANRHNRGLVEDSAWPCNCGLAEILK
jgi:hypothetical protein